MTLGPHAFTLRQLQYAVAVAEALSFRKAAERCHVSQPSLSAQLAQMEDALGVRLFERDRRRVLLTSAGEDLVARAHRVLTEADDIASAARRLSEPFTGTLRIGVIPTVSPYLLPLAVPALREKYPRLAVLWSEDRTAALLRDVAEGRLDAALLALVSGMEELDREVIAEDAFVLAGAPGHALLKAKRPAHPSDLEGESVLLLEEGHCFRDQALAICAGVAAREAGFRATSLTTLAQMVAGGAGVTLLPELSLAVENRRSELAVRRFVRPVPCRTIVLAWRKQSPLGPSLRALAGTARDASQRHGP